MRFRVKVKPNAKRASARLSGKDEFEISVTEKPTEGRANSAVLKALAGYLKVSSARLRLVSGARGKIKFFELK